MVSPDACIYESDFLPSSCSTSCRERARQIDSGDIRSRLISILCRLLHHAFHFFGHLTAKCSISSMVLLHILQMSESAWPVCHFHSLALVPMLSCSSRHHGVKALWSNFCLQKNFQWFVDSRQLGGILNGGFGGS